MEVGLPLTKITRQDFTPQDDSPYYVLTLKYRDSRDLSPTCRACFSGLTQLLFKKLYQFYFLPQGILAFSL